jgi:hypothetical protein
VSIYDDVQAECGEIYKANANKTDARNEAIDHAIARLADTIKYRPCLSCGETLTTDDSGIEVKSPYNPDNNTCLICGK